MTETISCEPQSPDCWVCICKNTPDTHGFYPCAKTGQLVEPDAKCGWVGHYRCDFCGKIIDGTTREVIGTVKL